MRVQLCIVTLVTSMSSCAGCSTSYVLSVTAAKSRIRHGVTRWYD